MQRQGFPRLFYHSEGEGEGRCEAAIDSEERTDGGEGRSIRSSQIYLVLKNWEMGRPMTPSATGKRHRVYMPHTCECQGFDPWLEHLWGIFPGWQPEFEAQTMLPDFESSSCGVNGKLNIYNHYCCDMW
ncbi:hypothetical protein LXL04_026936 [Taraxacum kok-saghyz]